MKFWIDCEWNSYKGALISLALVDEAGESFYAAIPCDKPDPWVEQNVIPVIGDALRFPSKDGMRAALAGFLSRYRSAHIIADWPEDIERFCELLIVGPGRRINTPPLMLEIKRTINSDKSAIPHNALEDARAMRMMDMGAA